MSGTDNQALIAQILSSYLSNNTVSPADLPSVIETVKRAFSGGTTTEAAAPVEETKKWEPAFPIKKSVTPDAVYCLCCGEKFKSLKRHLQSEHKMTPEEYRVAFNLKSDHPIVAPNYAAQRSELAKSLGLGRRVTKASPAPKKAGVKAAATRKAASA